MPLVRMKHIERRRDLKQCLPLLVIEQNGVMSKATGLKKAMNLHRHTSAMSISRQSKITIGS